MMTTVNCGRFVTLLLRIYEPINWTDRKSILMWLWCCYNCRSAIVRQNASTVSRRDAVSRRPRTRRWWKRDRSNRSTLQCCRWWAPPADDRLSRPASRTAYGIERWDRDIERRGPEIAVHGSRDDGVRHCQRSPASNRTTTATAATAADAHNTATVTAISVLCDVRQRSTAAQWTCTWLRLSPWQQFDVTV